MIYNDHKKYTTALITLNKAHTLDFIKENKITSAKELVSKLKEELLSFDKQPEFKGKFPAKWIPSNFQIIEEEFSEANAMINSTLKMVRHKITATYQERLELMYGQNSTTTALDKNIEVLEQMFNL
jgi:long-chain acyl-CoA synthetase